MVPPPSTPEEGVPPVETPPLFTLGNGLHRHLPIRIRAQRPPQFNAEAAATPPRAEPPSISISASTSPASASFPPSTSTNAPDPDHHNNNSNHEAGADGTRGSRHSLDRRHEHRHNAAAGGRTTSNDSSSSRRTRLSEFIGQHADSSSESFDYQALEYIDPVDESLICPICRTAFHHPVTTQKCGHTFCLTCLNRAHEIQPHCPLDRIPFNFNNKELFCTRIISHQLDRLQVKCPNHDKGCTFVTSRGLMPTHHQRDCDYTMVRCPDYPRCEQLTMRMDATPDIGCLHFDTRCEYCQSTVQMAELESHYNRSCSGQTGMCPQCDAVVARHRMPQHVAQDCLEQETECKCARLGCPVVGPRRIVARHETQGCIYDMIGYLMRERTESRSVITALSERLASLENRMEAVEAGACPLGRAGRGGGLRSHTDGHEGHEGGSWSSEVFGRRDLPPNMFESHEDYMLAQFQRLEVHLEELQKTVAEMDSRQSLMLIHETLPLKNQVAELRSNIGVIGMHTAWLMNAQRQNRGRHAATSSSTPLASGDDGRPGMGGGNAGRATAGAHAADRPSTSAGTNHNYTGTGTGTGTSGGTSSGTVGNQRMSARHASSNEQASRL